MTVQSGDINGPNRHRRGGVNPLWGAGPAGVCGAGRWTGGGGVGGGDGGQRVWPAEQLRRIHLWGQTARTRPFAVNSDPWRLSAASWCEHSSYSRLNRHNAHPCWARQRLCSSLNDFIIILVGCVKHRRTKNNLSFVVLPRASPPQRLDVSSRWVSQHWGRSQWTYHVDRNSWTCIHDTVKQQKREQVLLRPGRTRSRELENIFKDHFPQLFKTTLQTHFTHLFPKTIFTKRKMAL